MNVFCVGTGRCGTKTFSVACSHLHNFTSGHESNARRIGADRLRYPPNHVEADARLTWFLGGLLRCYPDAFFVWLRRDREQVVQSYVRREIQARAHGELGILHSFGLGLPGMVGMPVIGWGEAELVEAARAYCQTVEDTISLAFRVIPEAQRMHLELRTIRNDFWRFMAAIGAEGDRDRAVAEWDHKHNH